MKQAAFVAAHGQEWESWRAWLHRLERKPGPAMREPQAEQFPAAYRRLCQQLALARARGYSREVTELLQRLVQAGHRVLYRPPRPRWMRGLHFVVEDFPRLVRAEWRCMLAASVLLYVPLLATLLAVVAHPAFAHTLFSNQRLASFEHMYNPAAKHLGRTSGTDLMMFGFYVMHNVGIAFRTFASGLLLGIGAVYVMAANGLIIGGVAGHLTAIGFGGPFWRFVATHSAFELTATVIAGGAGLRLGLTLLAPGRQRRGPAMVAAGWIGAQLVLGAFVMLVVAAFIEAYWSSIPDMPDPLRFGVAALMWVLVASWLLLGGRGARHAA